MFWKKWNKYVKVAVLVIAVIHVNMAYWTLSDIQLKCYDKVYKEHKDLNLYEKCSIYSLHIGICTYGWILSPEATRQQLYCLMPDDSVREIQSSAFSKSQTVKGFMEKNPHASINNPVWLCWNPSTSSFGHKTAYQLSIRNYHDFRCALAVNGSYLYKENGVWKITFKDNEFLYPHVKEATYIGPFKFQESLFRYLQEKGWLYVPKIIWILE